MILFFKSREQARQFAQQRKANNKFAQVIDRGAASVLYNTRRFGVMLKGEQKSVL